MGILTENDRQGFFAQLDPDGTRPLSSVTLEEMEMLATNFLAAAEHARVAQSNYSNIASFRRQLYAANPTDVLIPALTKSLDELHLAWPEVMPEPESLSEVQS